MGIKIAPKALKDIKKLPQPVQKRVVDFLQEVGKEANPLHRAKPLRGNLVPFYRFRLGDYRLLFTVEDTDLVILRVLHRQEAYQK